MLSLVAAVALSQLVVPVKNGTTITSSGSSAASGLFSGDVDLIATVGAVSGGGSIVFTVAAVDPLNPSGGAIASASTQSISSATSPSAVAVLHAGHSSSVVVSWAVTGTFSAQVWLSVQGTIPSEIQGLAGGFPIAVSIVDGGTGGGGAAGGAQDAGVYLLPGSSVAVNNVPVVQAVSVVDGGLTLPNILPDGGVVQAGQFGNWSVQSVIDGGLTIVAEPYQYGSVFIDGGGVTAYQGGAPWSVSPSGPNIVNLGDGGVLSTNIVGGSVTATVAFPNILPDGGYVTAGQGGNWGVLAVLDAGVPDGVGATVALNVADAGCIISLAGLRGAGMALNAGTLAATLTPEVSFDNGTTWNPTQFFAPSSTSQLSTLTVTNPNAATQEAIVLHGGESQARVAVTAFTSGTANCTLRATESDTHAVFIQGAASALSVSVSSFPNILPDGGAVSAYLTGASIVNLGDGGTLPTVSMGPNFVNHGDGGTVPEVIVGQSAPLTVSLPGDGGTLLVVPLGPNITNYGDGGTSPEVFVGQTTPVQVSPAGDGGVWSTNIVGGTVTATVTFPNILPDGGYVTAGQGSAGAYSAPWPTDVSEQTSCTSGVVLCTLTETPISLLAGAKSQTICNNFSTPTCFGFVPGLSCAPAIDAGTTLGIPLQPGQCFTQNGGNQMYCVDATTAMTTPDAGLNYASCK